MMFYLDPQTFSQYYNCSSFTDNEIELSRQPKQLIGSMYLLSGIFFIILYIPSLWVMFWSDLRNLTAYKLLLYLGFVDVITLLLNSCIIGVITIAGTWLCTNPHLTYGMGVVLAGTWPATCLCSLTLVVNRILDVARPKLAEALFNQQKVYFWLAIPTLYGVAFSLFTQPLIYNSQSLAFTFFPYPTHLKQSNTIDKDIYKNIPHTVNNCLIIILLSVSYVLFCCIMFKRYTSVTNVGGSSVKINLLIQSTSIALINLIAAALYEYIQQYDFNQYIAVLGQTSWIFNHGFSSVIFIVFNKTIRNKVKKMLSQRLNKIINKKNGKLQQDTTTKVIVLRTKQLTATNQALSHILT
uniref:Serpentine Receptor, class T n=1 Tax=Rhabditophanes sp. KR3021 TaxID=114890 RepID=A0AC35UF09_9BILA